MFCLAATPTMPIGTAITGIITLFLSFWAVNVVRDPKKWRLWWLETVSVLDVDTASEQRRVQERQMAAVSLLLCLLLVAMSVSCAFWTFDAIRDSRRDKTGVELEMARAKKEIESISSKAR